MDIIVTKAKKKFRRKKIKALGQTIIIFNISIFIPTTYYFEILIF